MKLIEQNPMQANKELQKILIKYKIKMPVKHLIGDFGWGDINKAIAEPDRFNTNYNIRFKRIDSWGSGAFIFASTNKKDLKSAIKELARLKTIANNQIKVLDKYL